jgi:hypothetical protein
MPEYEAIIRRLWAHTGLVHLKANSTGRPLGSQNQRSVNFSFRCGPIDHRLDHGAVERFAIHFAESVLPSAS